MLTALYCPFSSVFVVVVDDDALFCVVYLLITILVYTIFVTWYHHHDLSMRLILIDCIRIIEALLPPSVLYSVFIYVYKLMNV
jgi:hypothetical protein